MRATFGAGPLVIAHRGASGYRPEHSRLAYDLAIDQDADFIEADLVMTRDGALVCRHDLTLEPTTDVADLDRFAALRRAGEGDDGPRQGWWVEDFELEALGALRLRERNPQARPVSAGFDGQAQIVAFQDYIDIALQGGRRRGRPVGLYIELKHPRRHDRPGRSMAEAVVEVLDANGLNRADAPVVLQCFWPDTLMRLKALSPLPRVLLLDHAPPSPDVAALCGVTAWSEMLRPRGLARARGFADAVGPNLSLILPRDASGRSAAPTSLVRDAHAQGLEVHGWTFNAQNDRLPLERRRGDAGTPGGLGDGEGYARALFELGVDALFADHPDMAAAARDAVTR